jgi:hypothetical protein
VKTTGETPVPQSCRELRDGIGGGSAMSDGVNSAAVL